MATTDQPDSNWLLLLALALRSKGTTIDCYECKKGKVRQEGQYVDCPRCNGNQRLISHGFIQTDHAQLHNARILARQVKQGWHIKMGQQIAMALN